MLVFAGIASLALLIAAVAFLIRVTNSRDWYDPTRGSDGVVATASPSSDGGTAVPAGGIIKPAAGVKRFTLRLGQGFRFKDGVVVIRPDDLPDIVFKYLAPQAGGMTSWFNPTSKQIELRFEPTLSSPAPLLLSAHINSFELKPDVARITSGDIAGYSNQTPIGNKRYVLLMNREGAQYLLTLDQLEAPAGKFDDWRIGFTYEEVQLPVGAAGGKINKPLPGKLIFRDWSRTKMIQRVDLTSGKEETIADGTLPSMAGNRLFAYVDSTGAFIMRDAAAAPPVKTLNTMRFNEEAVGPLLSPDGKRVVATVRRDGPPDAIGSAKLPLMPTPSVGVFDLAGKEIVSFVGYDDAAWTPDGKLIATGKYNDPGLFELDPATKKVRPIDPNIGVTNQPSVSPDGKTVAFVTGNKVWLIDRDGKNLRQLFLDGHNQQRPAFSPDGTKVAFVLCNLFAMDSTGELFVLDLKSQELTPLRTNTGWALVPDPSSRLSWIP
jgi:hypothetical protein